MLGLHRLIELAPGGQSCFAGRPDRVGYPGGQACHVPTRDKPAEALRVHPEHSFIGSHENQRRERGHPLLAITLQRPGPERNPSDLHRGEGNGVRLNKVAHDRIRLPRETGLHPDQRDKQQSGGAEPALPPQCGSATGSSGSVPVPCF
jgi:hypothetical protein